MRSIVLALLCIALAAVQATGQAIDSTEIINYKETGKFEIAGVEVTGAEFSDENVIASIAGLQVGEKIAVPGPAIPKAIKALMHLHLFTNVEIVETKREGELIYLLIQVTERPRLSAYIFRGIKKSKQDDLQALVGPHLVKGGILTENATANARKALEEYFTQKGYPDAAISIRTQPVSTPANSEKLIFEIDRGDRVKVAGIRFEGNEMVSDKKLRKLLGINKRSKLFGKSQLIPEDLEAGKENILWHYNTIGYRDARILTDSTWRDPEGDYLLKVSIEEGRPYFFGKVSWKGNSVYSDKQLSQILGIEPGDTYNQELLDRRLRFSQDGRDISTLYLDNGYLFFSLETEEKAIYGDTIDLQVRLFEGPIATVDEVTVKGNDVTNDHVILRELRTKPGEKFSRTDIIRSQRQLMNLGYFNPETMGINTPVDPERGTVDIEYDVEEKSSDKFELSAGWGGSGVGLTGTVGVTLNNFSLRNLLHPKAWRPLPSGDGQRLSLRMQTNGKAYQSYNLSFTEPWLGGKRPNALTVATFYNRYAGGGFNREGSPLSRFNIFGATASLGKPLRWPDDNFILQTGINYQRYGLQDWGSGLFRTENGEVVSNGTFNNLNLSAKLTRSTISNPLFPTEGSRFTLSAQLTPPFSLISGRNYSDAVPEDKFRWLEYHKWRFDAEWYTPLVGKLVLKASAKFGFLGSYNPALGLSPFERFQIGGDGLNNIQGGFTGTDILALRGYEVEDLENNYLNGELVATPIFNKYTLELRYPISLNPSATIYALGFLEGGNSWQSFQDYRPFDIKRSAGVGLRVFLPMFGTLGFDYGIGFDKAGERSFSNMGKFSIILGFEPE